MQGHQGQVTRAIATAPVTTPASVCFRYTETAHQSCCCHPPGPKPLLLYPRNWSVCFVCPLRSACRLCCLPAFPRGFGNQSSYLPCAICIDPPAMPDWWCVVPDCRRLCYRCRTHRRSPVLLERSSCACTGHQQCLCSHARLLPLWPEGPLRRH